MSTHKCVGLRFLLGLNDFTLPLISVAALDTAASSNMLQIDESLGASPALDIFNLHSFWLNPREFSQAHQHARIPFFWFYNAPFSLH